MMAERHPDVFSYHLNSKGTQKNVPKIVLGILSPHIIHVKTTWNIVYKFLKMKVFSKDTNILPQIHWISNIFEHSATTIGGFCVPLNYPILNFKKTVCPKNVWMRHWMASWKTILNWSINSISSYYDLIGKFCL